MSDALIVGIIAAVAGLLSPVVGWFLNQQGESRRTKKLEALKARIDLIEKLSDSRVRPPEIDNDIEKVKIREIRAVLAEMEALSETERARIAISGAEMSRWKRATLAYDQISHKGRIYKGLFYAFTFFAVAGAAAGLSVSTPGEWVFALIGCAFYLMIGLAFRRAAVRTYEEDKKMAAATQHDA
jgi:hypothetical protein